MLCPKALLLLAAAYGWAPAPNRAARTAVELRRPPSNASKLSVSAADPATVEAAVSSLAATTLALLSGDDAAAKELCGDTEARCARVRTALEGYDACRSGTLSREEAEQLFGSLARELVREIATSDTATPVATKHAARILEDDARGTIDRVATKLFLLADTDGDGRIDLAEFAGLFDQVKAAPEAETFPLPLRALAGSLQLLPPSEAAREPTRAAEWHIGVPGDDHTLRTVQRDGFSVVGIGRSADASAYFIPEFGVCFDAGLSVASIQPKSVFLTHGHRDHTAALPVLARKAAVFAPRAILPLVRKFLVAEAQLNFGAPQTDAETEAWAQFRLTAVDDKDDIVLDKACYQGSPTPLGLQVLEAPHKRGVPACSYGLYRKKSRLKEAYAALPKAELGRLIRDDVQITEEYQQGLVFFSGDTTIQLLRQRHLEILPKYETLIHEVTFYGEPSEELDAAAAAKGHTHYAQLHPFIAAFPRTTFILVHWSLRYGKEEILAFFEAQYGGVPKNVVLWI